jgi:hypothetical protein
MAEHERRPIILSVHPVGSPEYQQFGISDEWLRWYDGDGGWTEDQSRAALYAASNDACVEVQRLLLLDYAQLPHKRYRAPVYLDLFCDHEIPEIEIKRWLHRVAKLLIDSPSHGNGPGVDGSLGLCRIEWSELKELQEEGSV